jgi:hypothetical protein
VSANLSTGTILLICVLYAWKHRGADAPGMILAFTLGVISSHSSLGALANPIADVIVSAVQAILDAINKFVSDRGTVPVPTPANGLVALRYNLALLGIGR